MKKKKKIIMILCGLLLLLFITIGGILVAKQNQLNQLIQMNSDEMFEADIKSIKDAKISYATFDCGDIQYYSYTSREMKKKEKTNWIYEIGSISKTYLALLVSKAVEEGKIKLSDSIANYLDLPKDKYYPTIERLLTHTSGYKAYYLTSEMISNHLSGNNDFYKVSKEKILKKVKTISLKDKDYGFVYSNFGISVVSLVIEEVYQKSYRELMMDLILNELGLTTTSIAPQNQLTTNSLTGYWKWEENDGYLPAGGILSTIEDQVRYLSYYLSETSTMVKNTYESKKEIHASNPTYEKMGIRMDEIGLTWIIDTKNHFYWHNGSTTNFTSYLAFDPIHQKGVVILANFGSNKKIPVTVIGPRLMMELLEETR
jgi:CubicO group peptidase (beta-lactamase class C family)